MELEVVDLLPTLKKNEYKLKCKWNDKYKPI